MAEHTDVKHTEKAELIAAASKKSIWEDNKQKAIKSKKVDFPIPLSDFLVSDDLVFFPKI